MLSRGRAAAADKASTPRTWDLPRLLICFLLSVDSSCAQPADRNATSLQREVSPLVDSDSPYIPFANELAPKALWRTKFQETSYPALKRFSGICINSSEGNMNAVVVGQAERRVQTHHEWFYGHLGRSATYVTWEEANAQLKSFQKPSGGVDPGHTNGKGSVGNEGWAWVEETTFLKWECDEDFELAKQADQRNDQYRSDENLMMANTAVESCPWSIQTHPNPAHALHYQVWPMLMSLAHSVKFGSWQASRFVVAKGCHDGTEEDLQLWAEQYARTVRNQLDSLRPASQRGVNVSHLSSSLSFPPLKTFDPKGNYWGTWATKAAFQVIRKAQYPVSFHRCQKTDSKETHNHLSTLSYLETVPRVICYKHLLVTPWNDKSDDRYMEEAGLSLSRKTLLRFRKGLFNHLGLSSQDGVQLAPSGQLRVLVYDRLDAPYNHMNGGRRALINGAKVAAWIEEHRIWGQSLPWNATSVRVTYLRSMSSLSWPAQVHLFHDTDVLIAPHGAHMSNAIFMPLGAGIVEMTAQCGKIKSFLGKYHTIAALGHRYKGITTSWSISCTGCNT